VATPTNVSCLPKAQGAKTNAIAPVDHNWDNIIASTNTSIEVPGTSDAVNMVTDTSSLAVGAMISSFTSDGQGEPVPASLEDRQLACDVPRSRTIATSIQVCSTPTPLKWADEDPDFEQTSSTVARPPSTSVPLLRIDRLPKSAADLHDVLNSQPHPTLSAVDTDETPVQTDTSTDSRAEHMSANLFRTGTTRTKKLQVDKFGETSKDRKCNRTRNPVSSKEKYYRTATLPSFIPFCHPTRTHCA
jgi:hypothetical protein